MEVRANAKDSNSGHPKLFLTPILFKQLQHEARLHQIKYPDFPMHDENNHYLHLQRFVLTQLHAQSKEETGKEIFKKNSVISTAVEPDWHQSTRDMWGYANRLGHLSVIQYLFLSITHIFRDIPHTITTLKALQHYLIEKNRETDFIKITHIVSGFDIHSYPQILSHLPFFLLNYRVNWPENFKGEMTPLKLAVTKDNLAIVTLLLKFGAEVWGAHDLPSDLNAHQNKSHKGYTPLAYAILNSKKPALIQALLHHVKGPIDGTYMIYALKKDRRFVVEFLINYGILPAYIDLIELNLTENSTYLQLFLSHQLNLESLQKRLNLLAHYAIAQDFLNLWKQVIHAGLEFDHDIFDHIAKTRPTSIFPYVYLPNARIARISLCQAVMRNDLPLVTHLITLGHSSLINEFNDVNNKSPLLLACELGNYVITEYLLINRANVNIKHPLNGETPLTIAAIRNDLVMIHLLLKFDADISCKNAKQENALDIARSRGFKLAIHIFTSKLMEIFKPEKKRQRKFALSAKSKPEPQHKKIKTTHSDISIGATASLLLFPSADKRSNVSKEKLKKIKMENKINTPA